MAKSLEVLLKQINAQYPGRDKSSDGGIGNAEHASRSSDHNPWVMDGRTGVVTARDFTHDPDHGLDSEVLAETLRASRDPRIKNIISNKKICSSKTSPWKWREYHGSNPHNHHCHVSVISDKAQYDDTRPWDIKGRAIGLIDLPDEEDSHSEEHAGAIIADVSPADTTGIMKPLIKSRTVWSQLGVGSLGLGSVASSFDGDHIVAILKTITTNPLFWVGLGCLMFACTTIYLRWQDKKERT